MDKYAKVADMAKSDSVCCLQNINATQGCFAFEGDTGKLKLMEQVIFLPFQKVFLVGFFLLELDKFPLNCRFIDLYGKYCGEKIIAFRKEITHFLKLWIILVFSKFSSMNSTNLLK